MKNETNTQHTPAPWSAAIDQYENVLEITSETNGVIVAKIPFISENHPSFKKDEANAQLIARAPELLKENEQLNKSFDELFKQSITKTRTINELQALNAELLEHGKTLVQWCNRHGYVPPCKGQLESAIAKAEAKNLPVS